MKFNKPIDPLEYIDRVEAACKAKNFYVLRKVNSIIDNGPHTRNYAQPLHLHEKSYIAHADPMKLWKFQKSLLLFRASSLTSLYIYVYLVVNRTLPQGILALTISGGSRQYKLLEFSFILEDSVLVSALSPPLAVLVGHDLTIINTIDCALEIPRLFPKLLLLSCYPQLIYFRDKK